MAKKTTSRSNVEPKPDAADAPPPAAKPRSRARAGTPQQTEAPMAMADDRATTVAESTGIPTSLSLPRVGERSRAAADSTSFSMASEPSEEDIRMRAYHRYLERGGRDGMDFDDWLQAERELRAGKAHA